jgi:hypothetical protein
MPNVIVLFVCRVFKHEVTSVFLRGMIDNVFKCCSVLRLNIKQVAIEDVNTMSIKLTLL